MKACMAYDLQTALRRDCCMASCSESRSLTCSRKERTVESISLEVTLPPSNSFCQAGEVWARNSAVLM